jgi:hypothetical protein
MKSSEFIPQNSLGKPIQNYANFKRWFKNSVARDERGRPLVVYHGTGSSFEEFSLDFRSESQGNDQYGPGFYTTSSAGVAGHYVDGKNPNIIPLYISIQQPMSDETPAFEPAIVQKLITSSPNFEDAILNFGDPSFQGKAKVLRSAVNAYGNYEHGIQQIMTIMGDFWYSISPLKFLALVTKLTGYDGTVVDVGAAGKFYIAWQPYQLKSVYNNGEFSSNTGKIMGETVEDTERSQRYYNVAEWRRDAKKHGMHITVGGMAGAQSKSAKIYYAQSETGGGYFYLYSPGVGEGSLEW